MNIVNILKLDLKGQKSGQVYLNYWDHDGGKDRVFRVDPNGDVFELSYANEPEENDSEIWTRIDLIQEFLKTASNRSD